MRVDARVTPELEKELIDRQPWMHPYLLADDVIVGYFKDSVPDGITACVSTSPVNVIDAMSTAFGQRMAQDPAYALRVLVERVGRDGRYLDIACASGWQ